MRPLLRTIIVIFSITNVYPAPHHHTGTVVNKAALKDIPPEYLKALRVFNRQNVQAPSFSNFDRSPDAVFSDPVTLATLWAVVNEPVFDIETVEIHRALGLIPEEIPKVYASVNNFLSRNMSILTTSAIFTRRHNISLSAGLERLHTYVETMDFAAENLRGQVAQNISAYVSDHTDDFIRTELLPDLDPPMEKSTDSVVVTTMSYTQNFSQLWRHAEGLKFRVGPGHVATVDSLEANGVFQIYEAENWTTVVIPIDEQATKNLIFVQATDLEQFLENDFEIFSQKVDTISRFTSTKFPFFQQKSLRIQVPVLNLTLARKISQEVEPVAETKLPHSQSAICDTTTSRREFLQTPVQVSKLQLSMESLRVATAIAVQVDNVKEYREELGSPVGLSPPVETSREIMLTTEAAELEQTVAVDADKIKRGYRNDNGDIYIPVEIRREAKQGSIDLAYQDITFNRPFFMAVHEYNVGMFNFLAVRDPSGRTDENRFSEYEKLRRWLCIPPPPPPKTG